MAIIFDEYFPYVMTGESINKVKVLTPRAQPIWAKPVSFDTTKLQFFIIGRVCLILSFSKESQFFPTSEFLNLFIKSISFVPPAI